MKTISLSDFDLLISKDFRDKAILNQIRNTIELSQQNHDDFEWIAACLTKIERALGFGNDDINPNVENKCLERIRDLIAAEGELGDLKEKINSIDKQHKWQNKVLDFVD